MTHGVGPKTLLWGKAFLAQAMSFLNLHDRYTHL